MAQGVSHGIEGLKALLTPDQSKPHYISRRVCVDEINVLPQPRRTFENISELAEDIRDKDLLKPPIIAELDRESCKKYLSLINLIWQASFSIGDLCVHDEKRQFFYILIAGERRYRACTSIDPKFTAEVRICKNIAPITALFLQFSENTHVAVPKQEEAESYAQLYRLIKIAHPRFSIAEFARKVGRHPGTISKALRFYDLPNAIKESVENSEISYTVALELARLQDALELSEKRIVEWLMHTIARNLNHKQLKEVVDDLILDRTSGQTSLLDIMTETQLEDAETKNRRWTVQENALQGIYAWTRYISTVLRMFEDGRLGLDDSPFSHKSPLRALKRLVELCEKLLTPHLSKLLSEQETERHAATLRAARETIEGLETALVEEN